jgi:hypothetical protein
MPTPMAGARSIAPCEGEAAFFGDSVGRRESTHRVQLQLRIPESVAALFSGQPSSLAISIDVYGSSPITQPGIGDL